MEHETHKALQNEKFLKIALLMNLQVECLLYRSL